MDSLIDDELLGQYLTESREHLASIEADLLAIEARGADIDEKLVNKVFRAAHSIKGGSSFFDLVKIQELAHKVENVLNMIRSRQMVPSPEVVNILLQAFDRLRGLIDNTAASNEADISEFVVSLTGLTASYLPQDQKKTVTARKEIPIPEKKTRIAASEFDLEQARKSGSYVYLIEIDLIHDIQRRNKTPLEVIRSLISCGSILETLLDTDSAGTLDDEPSNKILFQVLFATGVDPLIVGTLLEVPPERIWMVQDPGPDKAKGKDAAAAASAGPAAPSAPAMKMDPPKAPVAAKAPEAVPDAAAPKEPARAAPKASEGLTGAAPAGSETTLRVHVALLESLMNLAGELVLSRNQLSDAISRGDPQAIRAGGQRINLVTSELQEAVMQTRMQPIGNIFAKFSRLVRDLSQKLGKNIQLEVTGNEVELDKTLVEGLGDPLTHMIRNSVDHGIEMPDARAAAGKVPCGKVHIKAYHQAGQVVVEITDDGKGIDPGRIAAAAVAMGLLPKERVQAMSNQEKISLIFLPGLSTAEKVTDVSGRGVGMDVVKSNVDRLGGKVEIDSCPGKGTCFRIKLPLTLAIIPSLLVSAGGDRFAIPQVGVNELIRLTAEQVKKRIETVGDVEVLVLRENLIPLVHLADVLGMDRSWVDSGSGRLKPDRRRTIADRRSPRHSLLLETAGEGIGRETPAGQDGDLSASGGAPVESPGSMPRTSSDRRFHAASDLSIVVVNAGSFDYGLVVDDLHDTVEIVVKPLGRHLKGLREYAGATILGDGQVAVILDAAGLAVKAGLTSISGSSRARELAGEAQREKGRESQAFLLFHNCPTEPCAVPLDLVARVEEIRPEQIELVGGRRTMQYRGTSLPLVSLGDMAEAEFDRLSLGLTRLLSGEGGQEELQGLAEKTRDGILQRVGGSRRSASGRKDPGNSGEVPGQELVVVVFEIFGREIGLAAAKPIDVVETGAFIDQSTLRQNGIVGSAIIKGKTTLILDIFELVETAHPEWSGGKTRSPSAADGKEGDLILLAEDSEFFRGQLKKFLDSGGYRVLTAVDGQDAWEILQRNAGKVSLVVTDIEMPGLSGLDLARNIRADGRFAGLPVIAVTSLAGEEDLERGKAAGISDYQIKLDKERLLQSIQGFLQERLAMTA